MIQLGINITPIAMMRQNRITTQPDPVAAIVISEMAGAGTIVVPMPDDNRFFQENEIALFKQVIKSHFTLQIPPKEASVLKAVSIIPDLVTFTNFSDPKRNSTITQPLSLHNNYEQLEQYISLLRSQHIPACLNVEPDIYEIKMAARLKARFVELNTGNYTLAKTRAIQVDELNRLHAAALAAKKIGLGIIFSNGLSRLNLPAIVKNNPIDGITIGHSVFSAAVFSGLETAVRELLNLLPRQ